MRHYKANIGEKKPRKNGVRISAAEVKQPQRRSRVRVRGCTKCKDGRMRLPPVGKQIKNFADAVIRHVKTGLPQRPEAQQRHCLDICNSCEYLSEGGRCTQCGCFTRLKVRWSGESCPLGKWAESWQWACVMTTAKRKEPKLDESAASVLSAGWDKLHVVAEPDSPVCNLPEACEVHQNKQRYGCFYNTLNALRIAVEQEPNATAVLLVQDDVTIAPDSRTFLEQSLWPSATPGLVSLYAPDRRGYEQGVDEPTCRKITTDNLIGACALVFPRAVVELLLQQDEAIRDWPGGVNIRRSDFFKAAVDAWFGVTLHKLERDTHYLIPSLAQHIARHSSIGHGGNTGRRRSDTYRDGISAFDLHPMPTERYDSTGEIRTYREQQEQL